MDDYLLCPDCGIEHAEPLEATLGHLARCLTCTVLLEAETAEQPRREPRFEIPFAA